MSMSTHVVGIRPPDEKWRSMKAVWDACQAANTSVPEEVREFFDYIEPDEMGITVDLSSAVCTEDYRTEYAEGYEIDLELLPDNITRIRIYNSW